MKIHRLSAAAIRNAKLGFRCDGGGLYLQTTRSQRGTNRSWVFRFTRNGRTRDMGLGPLATVGVAQAREKARRCRELLLDGVDPIEDRKAKRTAIALEATKAKTFDECRDQYFREHRGKWRSPKHAHEWITSLQTYVTPVLGKLPVKDIDLALVIKALEPIWNIKPETSNRIRSRIETVLDFAKVSGWRSGDNPASWHLLGKRFASRMRLAPPRHFVALPYGQIGSFMGELRARQETSARALEFLILCTARTSEALGARCEEINLDERVWTIPASRMKGGREHRVPLSDAALAVLGPGHAAGGLVFPGSRRDRMADSVLHRLVRRMGYAVTVHGFRSTFRDWVAERTSFEVDVAEAALAHLVGNKTRAAYERGDKFEKRRRLMDAWGRFCTDTPAISGEVQPIRAVS
jgi:integrase